jgi:hypothetical protein
MGYICQKLCVHEVKIIKKSLDMIPEIPNFIFINITPTMSPKTTIKTHPKYYYLLYFRNKDLK